MTPGRLRALDGIDRLSVMTGYTVAMTHPAKTITDAASAIKAGGLTAATAGGPPAATL